MIKLVKEGDLVEKEGTNNTEYYRVFGYKTKPERAETKPCDHFFRGQLEANRKRGRKGLSAFKLKKMAWDAKQRLLDFEGANTDKGGKNGHNK